MSEAGHFAHILKTAPTADRAILAITFLLTVFADLVVAVNVGVILAVLHFLRRMAEVVETSPVEAQALKAELQQHGIERLPRGVVVYEIAGPMFFGAVEQFASALLQTHTDPETLILRLRRVPFMDATGIQTLDEVCTKLRRRGVQVVLTEANERVLAKLQKAHVVPQSASDHYAAAFGDALRLALMHAASRDDAPDPAPDASRQGLSAVAERLIDTSRRYLQDRNCR